MGHGLIWSTEIVVNWAHWTKNYGNGGGVVDDVVAIGSSTQFMSVRYFFNGINFFNCDLFVNTLTCSLKR